MLNLDAFDKAILNHLQRDNRVTSDVLGAEIGLSPTACQRRIKRLRQQGAIRKDVSVLSPDLIGERISMIVLVELKRGRSAAIDQFTRRMQSLDEVQQCYYTVGDVDFVLIVTAASLADYEIFTREVFFDNADIRRFTSIPALRAVKLGLQIPLA